MGCDVQMTPQIPKDVTFQDPKPDDLGRTEWWKCSPPGHVTVASWLSEPPANCLEVTFLPQAETQLKKFVCRKGYSSSMESTTFEMVNSTSANSDKMQESKDIDPMQEGEIDLTDQRSSKNEHLDVECESRSDTMAYEKLDDPFILESFASIEEVREAIVEMLRQDPRSIYRRTKCTDQSYQVSIDNLNLSCTFVGDKCVVTDVQSKTLWKNKRYVIYHFCKFLSGVQ